MTQTMSVAVAHGTTPTPPAVPRRHDPTPPPRLAPVDEEHLHRAVQCVIRFMHEHLADPITADQIAETAHFSKFHFTRVFQRLTGESPGRFLTNLRFERAEELLVSTDLKVIDISYEVGFASVGTFSTRFRDRTGVSPSAFRRRRRTAPSNVPYLRGGGNVEELAAARAARDAHPGRRGEASRLVSSSIRR